MGIPSQFQEAVHSCIMYFIESFHHESFMLCICKLKCLLSSETGFSTTFFYMSIFICFCWPTFVSLLANIYIPSSVVLSEFCCGSLLFYEECFAFVLIAKPFVCSQCISPRFKAKEHIGQCKLQIENLWLWISKSCI